jgi:hypothetical protein
MEAELEAASVFVLSSSFEGMSLALLEAMAKGLAVVAFDNCRRPVPGDRARRRRPARAGRRRARARAGDLRADRVAGAAAAARRRRAVKAAAYGIESVGPRWDALIEALTCLSGGCRGSAGRRDRDRGAGACAARLRGRRLRRRRRVLRHLGFLITRLLVGELDRSGRVSVTRFYARRVKRLMPQALTVIAAVVVAASAAASPLRRRTSSPTTSVAAGAYAMNWHLSAEAVDYFASGRGRPAARPPVVAGGRGAVLRVWPWLLLALAGVVAARAAGRGRGVAAASFGTRWRPCTRAPEAAYYSAFGRAWELGLGRCSRCCPRVGGAHPKRPLSPRPGRRVVAWLGLAAIAVSVVTFGAARRSPGPPRWCRRSARRRDRGGVRRRAC